MSYDRAPNLDDLVACGARVAAAMGQREPDPAPAAAIFDEILFQRGGRELWACLKEGLITETELRDATIARFATWLSETNGVEEPSYDTWGNAEIERSFEIALFGRSLVPSPGPST